MSLFLDRWHHTSQMMEASQFMKTPTNDGHVSSVGDITSQTAAYTVIHIQRSNTAMTMPDKLTAWEFMPSEQNEWLRGGWDYSEERSHEMKYRNYVAADITKDIARALQMAVDYGWMHSDAIDALARYNEVKDK